MEQYDAMMDSQLPASNQNAMPNYQVPISFPQFSVDNNTMNSSYGNLPGMAGSYPTSLSTPGNNISMGGYNAPGSQPSPYNSSSSSFSMPYDPPTMQGTPSLPMPAPPSQPSSNKPIYSCTYCGLVLSSNNALIEHKRIHTGERPYACHICNKRFTQKAHLNIHKRIHTGEKPYACHICHKRFAQSSHLSSHKRIHTGEKPFVCGICHIGFTQKQRLDAHLKKHIERPGEDISVGTRRSSLMMANQAQMMDRMEAYRQSLPRDESGGGSMMHMVGQGMPYIKQESGMGEMAPPANSHHHQHPQHQAQTQPSALDYQSMHDRRESAEDLRQVPGGTADYNKSLEGKPESGENKSREDMEVERRERHNNGSKTDGKDQSISTPSFSSEGMFLHPSGYVAYGGIEDNEEGQQSPRTGPANQTASASQQHMSPSGSTHRRKSSVVRKRHSESPDKDTDGGSGEKNEAMNGISRFHALNQDVSNTGGDAAEEEEDEEDVENNEPEEFRDTGEILDDKNDPPYHGNMNSQRNVHYDSVKKGSQPGNLGVVETRSHSRRTSLGHDEAVNGDRMIANPAPSLSYTGPVNAHNNSGLVKINNRISLVNFTADELVTHLIKRDDVHCCQFCCLIFQDAAMYHIHRNMHDKQDIRKCNMCGKMLLDKYDFTAHFLSMHQS